MRDLAEWMNAVWMGVFGFPARSVDVQVVRSIMDEEDPAPAIADILWDHWMGEPEEPSLEQVESFVREIGEALDEESNT